MYEVLDDRVFWIYFIITLFFIIIGLGFILISNDIQMILIGVIWLVSIIALMLIIYYTSIKWGPSDNLVCVIDVNSGCFEQGNRVWLFINILFVALLVVSILWAIELSNVNGSVLRDTSGILMILGGLVLLNLSKSTETYNLNYVQWVAVGYLTIWVGLTIYTVISSNS